MNADLQGALDQLDRSYTAFVHKGERMTKPQVKMVLEYALKKGYKHTGELRDEEVDAVLSGKERVNDTFGNYDEDIYENDDHFEPCDNCDLPDACADFGCAIKQGLRKPSMF